MTFKEFTDKLLTIQTSDVVGFFKKMDRKTWGGCGAGLIFFILAWVFILQPAWLGRAALKKQNQEINLQISGFKTLSLKKHQLEQQKKEIETSIQSFQKKLFSEAEISLLLGKISKVAQDAQVDLVSSQPLPHSEIFSGVYEKKYKSTLYQLTVDGSYHRIADFVSRLESYPQYFQIQELSINPEASMAEKLVADIKLMAVSARMNDDGKSNAKN